MEQLLPKIPVFILILVRLSAFFTTVPFFSYKTIPIQARITVAIVLAWTLSYSVGTEAATLTYDYEYIIMVIKEALVGLLLGLFAYIILSAVQIAGSFIDFQIGFAIANVIDPMTGSQSPLIGQFFNTIALLLLIGTDGHHLLLDAIFYSYEVLPVDGVFPAFGDEATVALIIKTFVTVFAIAFQMSAPIVATIFLVDLALGITAKTVPQLNIFVIGFPVKIAVGFLVLASMMTVMIIVMQKMFKIMFAAMQQYMVIIGGG